MKHVSLIFLALIAVVLEHSLARTLGAPFDAISPLLTALLMIAVTHDVLGVVVFTVALACWSAVFTPNASAWLFLIFPGIALAVRAGYRAFFTRLTIPGILASAATGALLWSIARVALDANVLLHEWEQVEKLRLATELATNIVGAACLMFGMSIVYNRFIVRRETAYLNR